jgi:CheY-like chemotaxis protein
MPYTLLLADHSVTVQRVVELTFAEEGVRVISVGTGAQAIDRIEQDRPDIVLVDVNVPERDGYEVAAHVKRTPHLEHIPVVLMTGAFEQVDDRRARPAGYDGVLAKPFEPHMVTALVRDLLSRRGAAASRTPRGEDEREAATAASGFPFEPGASVAPSTSSLDDYFDRLDEALASSAPGDPRPPAAPSAHQPVAGRPTAGPVLADAFSALLADELGEAPSPSPAPARAPAPSPPARAVPAAPPTAAPELSEELIDAVTRRVVERFSEQAVRELVASTVLEVTERLVREEIERIKASA